MKKEKIIGNIVGLSVIIFFAGVLILMFYIYLLKETPPFFVAGVVLTSMGVGVVSLLLLSFLSMKEIDLDYFKNIMIGISGGLAVWIFSATDFSFKNGFWLTINGFLIRGGFALMIILIGYDIYKRKNENLH